MRFEPANTGFRTRRYCWHSRTQRFRLYENQSTPAKTDQHFGGPQWTMHAAVSSFLSRQKPIIDSMKPCAPSLSKDDDCKKSRSSLAIRNHRCARWSAGFGRTYRPMISAPFCPAAAWTTGKPSLRRHTRLAGNIGDRRPTSARLDSGATLAHARRWAISLLAIAGARAVRSVSVQSRISRFKDDSGG